MKRRDLLRKSITLCLLAGTAAFCSVQPAWAAVFPPVINVVSNNQLPQGGQFAGGSSGTITQSATQNIMNIVQNQPNAVIKWNDFSIGADAVVNFSSKVLNSKGQYNTLNYINSSNVSQIYGDINAANGNIYIVNPSGVQIGDSAQINVGSLYVSNKKLDENIIGRFAGDNINILVDETAANNAELMSLGNITAANVTFDGSRVVLDIDRVNAPSASNISIRTDNADNVVLGYTAFDSSNGTYAGANDGTPIANIITSEGTAKQTKANGYMWVNNAEELQAINTNLEGNYALRNNIAASATKEWNEGKGFKPIGNDSGAFTGKFDGITYDIFNLNINDTDLEYAGLFGKTNGAVINNVTMTGGSITGNSYVGSVIGQINGGRLSNVKNSANVSGSAWVGGIVGGADNAEMNSLVNGGKVGGTDLGNNLQNSIGGLVGAMVNNSSIKGVSYNIGDVSGRYNVGGIAGYIMDSVIGSESGQDYITNYIDVSGNYYVGGIAGYAGGSSVVQYVCNEGSISSEFYTKGAYEYHTNNADMIVDNEHSLAKVEVQVSNTGGIVGFAEGTGDKRVKINHAENKGDVLSATDTKTTVSGEDEFYISGNIGGIAGKAVATDIADAGNRENKVRGAHNVGGIAGYLNNSTITGSINHGGDIMATGARKYDETNYKKGEINDIAAAESVRPNRAHGTDLEAFNIGNMGGIAGYMYGESSYITNSANRGTVHSKDIDDINNIPESSKAANAGGVVGKIDREATNFEDPAQGAVRNSSNSGEVRGFVNIGGIAGSMYNGEITGSFNMGNISSTKKISTVGSQIAAVNMGGIAGDTTEETTAKVYIYDVYNKGQIGDPDFEYGGRHVGGVVGRLSGTVEKAYNNGEIYNNAAVTGGIAGWWTYGNMENVFNTGNITVLNKDNVSSAAGGLVGSVGSWNVEGIGDNRDRIIINNAYNLGTVRSFSNTTGASGNTNAVGGIIGEQRTYSRSTVTTVVNNSYTLGKLYAGVKNNDVSYSSSLNGLGGIVGKQYKDNGINYNNLELSHAYYISPENRQPDGAAYEYFKDLRNKDNTFTVIGQWNNSGNSIENKGSVAGISYDNRSNAKSFVFGKAGEAAGSQPADGNSDWSRNDWRIYAGSTNPILNAFAPNSREYFNKNAGDTVTSVQYGTAYDPLLTIVNVENNTVLSADWDDLGISNAAGLAVYGGSLTVNGFNNDTDKVGFYSGTIYADNALTINGKDGEDISLSAMSKLYGSSIKINSKGDFSSSGSIVSTGKSDGGDITINAAGAVSTTGRIESSVQGQTVKIDGIGTGAGQHTDYTGVNDYKTKMPALGTLLGTSIDSKNSGSIFIESTNNKDVNISYGECGTGFVNTAGDFKVKSNGGNIIIDSDISSGGNIYLDSSGINILDLSNTGKLQNNASQQPLNQFLEHFSGDHYIKIMQGHPEDIVIGVNIWDDKNKWFDLDQYSRESLLNLNLLSADGNKFDASKVVKIWISDGEQLKAFSENRVKNTQGQDGLLERNFALKNNINMSGIEDFKAIGGSDGYNGDFDGLGYRIISLDVASDASESDASGGNAGLFSILGKSAQVRNLKINCSTFTGDGNAGAVAAVNNGLIKNVITFGTTVEASGNQDSMKVPFLVEFGGSGEEHQVGAAGGIAGINAGSIQNAYTEGTVTAAAAKHSDGNYTIKSTAGGIAGINTSFITNSVSKSASVAADETSYGIGGVAGINTDGGTIRTVDSIGIVRGIYNGSTVRYTDFAGGIAGTNMGTIEDVYNVSDVTGNNIVGGIVGINAGAVNNAANASDINDAVDLSKGSFEYIGGLVGKNTANGSINHGRNSGRIYGNTYIGGMAGENIGKLKNIINDPSADIYGYRYVGGIAGINKGTVSAEDTNLVNSGTITGQIYVGGVAGINEGTIENTNNNVTLYVKDKTGQGEGTAKFFGGVAGVNKGTITQATNKADIAAEDAEYVGGVVGKNEAEGILSGMTGNYGNVTGRNYVGGVAGSNSAPVKDIKAENKGTVTALQGGAGGIFGELTGSAAISGSVLINSGAVKGAGSSGTGGIANANHGNIINSTLVNSGAVTNATGSNVGGIFGVNSGSITYSNMRNEIGGQVSGFSNVGGLVGRNTGIITGGRDAGDGYYKYRIYNNGNIFAAGDNAGGLFGFNSGIVTAAYNTGAVEAAGGDAGGIAGFNSGSLRQVFSNIMTASGADGYIRSSGNSGGIAGRNTGSISDAYSVDSVMGRSAGFAAGSNMGTVARAYGLGAAAGAGSAGIVADAYDISAGGRDWQRMGSYEGFGAEEWKCYDGHGTPLLRVFLTKVYSFTNEPLLVYNGQEQFIDIDALGVNAADRLAAYNNNHILIQSISHRDIGLYSDWLFSRQIAASGQGGLFNPNNLGYDIELQAAVMPPDNPGINNSARRYADHASDRKREFRERKAELNFQKGGMEI